jgi:uncharacterized protein YyaL (SSP411 family)
MPNRLAGSTSPYLLQHQHNPVDWYPWGEEALEKARREEKPIFLSIGYSACHWCHVMEHESFENPAIAEILNEFFVAIKVDREQRPDLDHIYMQAVQILTGSGGWPMSVFLTPDQKPFYGGTYWPPVQKWGRPGFDQVLRAVADAWSKRRGDLLEHAQQLTGYLQEEAGAGEESSAERLDAALLDEADQQLARQFDSHWGGFGGAPKFPHATDLKLLMRFQRRRSDPSRQHRITHTLQCMHLGGIYDHLGGGFSRYSVDERWLVPHFEKMLYDNSLLASCYLQAFRQTKRLPYQQAAKETLDYLLRDMLLEGGGLSSAEDADSEGEEGKFYVWTDSEINDLLGKERGDRFCRIYGVTPGGNFEGKSILNLLHHGAPGSYPNWDQIASAGGMELRQLQAELADDRGRLVEARDQRIRPGRDDKVLLSWNALAITCMAESVGVLQEPHYLIAAQRCARFLIGSLKTTRSEGLWRHVWRNGQAEVIAYLDDLAYWILAMIALHQADGAQEWIEEAVEAAELVLDDFADPAGGFFMTSKKSESLIARPKDRLDHSIPSGSGSIAEALLMLGTITGRTDFWEAGEGTLQEGLPTMRRALAASGQMLLALERWTGRGELWVIVLPEGMEFPATLRDRLHQADASQRLIRWVEDQHVQELGENHPAVRYRVAVDGEVTLYRCIGCQCDLPIVGLAAIEAILEPID